VRDTFDEKDLLEKKSEFVGTIYDSAEFDGVEYWNVQEVSAARGVLLIFGFFVFFSAGLWGFSLMCVHVILIGFIFAHV